MKKTDDSVKAGLEIRSGHEAHDTANNKTPSIPDTDPVDEDEKVHEQPDITVNENEEQDYDDIVHQLPGPNSSSENEEDLDDKVHRIGNQDINDPDRI